MENLVKIVTIGEAYEELEKAERTKAQKKAAKKYRLAKKTKRAIRPAKREEMATGDFLKPAQKKYPWKIGGKPSQKLLMAAYRRAITQREPAIAMKARRLLKRHFDKEVAIPEQAKK